MVQFRAQRISKTAHRRLGSAIGRLQGNGAIGQRRSNLYNRAMVLRAHMLQSGQRAIDLTQIGHLGNALEFSRRDVPYATENGRHRVVDPQIDMSPTRNDLLGCGKDLIGIGNVRLQNHRLAAVILYFSRSCVQPCLTACQQGNASASCAQFPRKGASNSGRGAGHNRNMRSGHRQNLPITILIAGQG